MAVLVIMFVLVAAALSGAVLFWRRSSRRVGTPPQRATYEALHTASLAVSALRDGLTADTAVRAAPALRQLLGTPVVAIADRTGLLACEGSDRHAAEAGMRLREVVGSGRAQLLSASDLGCWHGGDCPMRAGVAVPVAVDGAVIGALAALGPSADAALMRTAVEVARFVSTHLALAELDASRTRTVQAQLNFLRAQISPHFIYNALTAIESFVRSDPERARDLLVGFAEFIRWAFREHSQYATLAEELRFVDTYLELERARFGDRLAVSLRVAPEVLPVRVPSLVLQPLVENAVRHGLEQVSGTARLQISAVDGGHEAVVTVEDDGVGVDPRQLADLLAGRLGGQSVGLRNVDERLRATFGKDHGLTIETGIGAGTKVTMHLPKFSPALNGQ
ncbi:MAG: histidine kinase [Streptosporangiaceae bacterium]|nr:histidine kinase [Streptosporangiaceae bacterium]MBV9853659.1 histidine kinase [Streptosporangiaceae bacterium]